MLRLYFQSCSLVGERQILICEFRVYFKAQFSSGHQLQQCSKGARNISSLVLYSQHTPLGKTRKFACVYLKRSITDNKWHWREYPEREFQTLGFLGFLESRNTGKPLERSSR